MSGERYLVIPCDAGGAEGLSVIWDRLEEQVIDVIDARQRARLTEDDLWSARLSPTPVDGAKS